MTKVTVGTARTRDLADLVALRDGRASRQGKTGLVKGAWSRPGAVGRDVGINRLARRKSQRRRRIRGR